jgi:hypothetical protein
MFKEISRGHAWRDAWRGGVGTLAVRGHPTVSDSLAASLAGPGNGWRCPQYIRLGLLSSPLSFDAKSIATHSLGSDSARDVHKMGGETIPVLMAQ